MGNHYLGIEEALAFGCDPRLSELRQHAEVPAHLLAAIENDSQLREDCLLAIVLPISEDRLREHAASGDYDHTRAVFSEFRGYGFRARSTSPWHLVRKLVVTGSLLTVMNNSDVKSLVQKQLSTCPRAHKICEAEVQAYTQLLYAFVTGEKLQPGILARTDSDDDGDRIHCGWIDDTFKIHFGYQGGMPPIGLPTEWTGK